MATPVIMPRQGQTVESCIITEWHKEVGATVSAGDVLFSYETDKAAFDEVSPAEGILLARYFEENDDVPVLTTVCVIGQEGEDISAFAPGGAAVSAPEAVLASAPQGIPVSASEETPAPTPQAADGSPAAGDPGRIRISPRAKSLAVRAKIDHKDATPSGPAGRIIERDIVSLISERAATHPVTIARPEAPVRPTTGLLEGQASAVSVPQGPPTPGAAYEEIKLSNMRRRIAEAMHRSLSTTAQLTLHSSFDASDILAYRKRLKGAKADDPVSSVNMTHMILYAVSRTLLNHRSLNAHLLDDSMLLWNHVNLGIAVDTERGLMVPTLLEADQKSLTEIAMEAKRLADACRAGSISPDYLQNGTFTVTNLGALGVEYFTPVLNPPQTAILGVGTVVQRIRETEDGVEYYPAIGLSLTFDHRAVDGAPAARFLQELKDNLENLSVLLAR
jgi:pyruvate dehydrogenase E2 component (dihydrolipoamide acetyltransferase)